MITTSIESVCPDMELYREQTVNNKQQQQNSHMYNQSFTDQMYSPILVSPIHKNSIAHTPTRITIKTTNNSSSTDYIHQQSTPRSAAFSMQRLSIHDITGTNTPIQSVRKLHICTPHSNSSTTTTTTSTDKSSYTLIIAYIGLFIAILSFSAIGPTFVYLERLGIKPIQAISYRSQAMLLCLLPFTIIEYILFTPSEEKLFSSYYVPLSPQSIQRLRIYSNEQYDVVPSLDVSVSNDEIELQRIYTPSHITPRSPASKRRMNNINNYSSPTDTYNMTPVNPSTGWHALIYCALLSLSWGISLALWVVALQYTTTPRASLFASLYPLLLVIYMKCIGMSISAGEIFGVFVALIGICLSESMAVFTHESSTHSTSDRLYGDVLCVLSACLVSFNVIAANKARRVMRLFNYTFITTLGLTLIVSVMSLCVEQTTFTISHNGIFGWLLPELRYIILLFGFVVGCIGFMGLNYSVVHVPAIIYSTAQLLDPGLTAVMSYCSGLEGIPAMSTVVGFIVVTIGIVLVVYYENQRKLREQQTNDSIQVQ